MLEEIVRTFLPIWAGGVGEEGEGPGTVCVYLVIYWVCWAWVEDRPNFDRHEDCKEFAHEGGRRRDGRSIDRSPCNESMNERIN